MAAEAMILSDPVRHSSEHIGLLNPGDAQYLFCVMPALSQRLKRRQPAQSVIFSQ